MGRELRAAGVTVKVAEGIPIPLPPPPPPPDPLFIVNPGFYPQLTEILLFMTNLPPPPVQLKELAHNNESMVL